MDKSCDAIMRMVEEESQISPKRIKIEKEDRLSALPDCLLVDILSRLRSKKQAIRTCILSKRWKYVWTCNHDLIFKYKHRRRTYLRCDFFSSVDKILNRYNRQLLLNKLQLDLQTGYDSQVKSQVNTWICHAINCNVQELDFKFWIIDEEAEFELDQCFFNNSCSTDLKLSGCVFNPNGAITWKNLKSLYIEFGNLDEDLIENILSGSPLLETLELDKCYGFSLLDITSKSVKNLVLSGYQSLGYEANGCGGKKSHSYNDIIVIKAPNILSLTIEYSLLLWKLLLQDVSSLVKAELNYTQHGYYETTRKESEEEMLKGILRNLPQHVEELIIWGNCLKTLTRLESKGFVKPSNVKVPKFDVASYVRLLLESD